MRPLQNIFRLTFYFLKSIHSPSSIMSPILFLLFDNHNKTPLLLWGNATDQVLGIRCLHQLLLCFNHSLLFQSLPAPTFHCTASHNDILQNTRQWLKRSNQIWRISLHRAFDRDTKQNLYFVDRLKIWKIHKIPIFPHPPPMRLVTQSHCQLLGVREPEIAHRQLKLLLSLLTAHKYASSLCPFFFAIVGMSHRFKNEMVELQSPGPELAFWAGQLCASSNFHHFRFPSTALGLVPRPLSRLNTFAKEL